MYHCEMTRGQSISNYQKNHTLHLHQLQQTKQYKKKQLSRTKIQKTGGGRGNMSAALLLLD